MHLIRKESNWACILRCSDQRTVSLYYHWSSCSRQYEWCGTTFIAIRYASTTYITYLNPFIHRWVCPLHPKVSEPNIFQPCDSSNNCNTLPSHRGTHFSDAIHHWRGDRPDTECQPNKDLASSMHITPHGKMFQRGLWFLHGLVCPRSIRPQIALFCYWRWFVDGIYLLCVACQLQDPSAFKSTKVG